MTRETNIADALQRLDHADDSHWTGSGLPRVDAVAELADEAGVTRSEINAIDPDLNRDSTSDTEPNVADVTTSPDVPDDGDVDEVKEKLQAEIDAVKAKIQEAMEARDSASKDILALEATCHILEVRHAALFPAVAPAASVKAYQQRSAEQREKRVAQAAQATGSAKSRLDRAMGHSRGFGMQRPEGFLIDGG